MVKKAGFKQELIYNKTGVKFIAQKIDFST